MLLFILLLFEIIAENLGAIIGFVLIALIISTIIEYIEIACVVLGIISLITSTAIFSNVTNECFNIKWIGVFVSIILHTVLYVVFGLSGSLFITLLILLIGTIYGGYEVDDGLEIWGIIVILATAIIPSIVMLNI